MSNFKTDKLLDYKPFDKENHNHEALFYNALLEELDYHYRNNKLYNKFCVKKGFEPSKFNGSLHDIPPVPVSVFKELGNDLNSVKDDQIKIILQSSATSGIPSTVLLDKLTTRRQAKAMIKVVQEFIGRERKPFLVLDINPQKGFSHLLGARYAAISGYLKFSNEVEYFLKVNENNNYYFDLDHINNYISNLNPNNPVVVFGFTHLLYSEVVRPNKGDWVLRLPEGSKIIHIGGWKKLENEKISKDKFNELVAELFGVKKLDVIDIYGFTEQMGLNYPDCECGFKHTPVYSRVIIRDPITKLVLNDNQTGLLEFITPIPHSYPGNVVLTDDVGFVVNTDCPTGRGGTRFKIIGRLKKAEVRGCGDILTSKLKFSKENSIKSSPYDKQLSIDFWSGENISKGSPNSQLTQIISELNNYKNWIRKQPIDALIGLISKVSSQWIDSDDLQDIQNKGLSYLSIWCRPDHLTRLATLGLRGNRQYIESFYPVLDSNLQYLKANQRGLVCHWLAGNVQVLGFFALVQSILTKNVNLLKVSSRDDGVFARLLYSFRDTSFTTPGGYEIFGNDLLKTIGVVYFAHNNIELGELMSKEADARIAWGGKEAVEAVSNLTSKYDCEDIIFGPKLSFSVISRERLINDRKIKKLARKVAIDISIFDQTGCASPHNLYIETGGEVSPKEFAEFLASAMDKVATQIPKGDESLEQIASIHSIRGLYEFKGYVWASADSTWTILLSEDMGINHPIYSRVIHIHPVDDISQTLGFIDDNIQTIGIAATGERALKYAEEAAEKGVMRLPEVGKMLNFESPWDGIVLMDRLVRWTTFLGPVV
jgi:hypothetical protein